MQPVLCLRMQTARVSLVTSALVLLSFVGVALVQTWPLALHLGDRFTGSAAGDTGVYVWNTWVFGHELVTNHASPFQTDTLPGLGGPVDLSLHNYTVFADVIALVLQPWLGTAAAFNVIFLLNFALAGLGMFLLVRTLPHTAPAGTAVAWLAALLFACAPFIVARGNGHFSVAAAAPLPFFAFLFYRTLQERHLRDAVCAGACVAWATYSDLYFSVYCVMLAFGLTLARVIDVHLDTRAPRAGARRWTLPLDLLIGALVTAVFLIHVLADGSLRIGTLDVSMRTLYTPILILSTLVAARLFVTLRPRLTWTAEPIRPLVVPAVVMVGTTMLLLSPLLYAMSIRAADGEMVGVPVPWRSSAPGVDLLAIIVPNPNHPLAPAASTDWVKRQPGEGAASIPFVALGVMAVAWWRTGHRPNRTWLAMTLACAWLALGPFIRIAGFETLIPTPWTFIRYLPVIGEARMPGRLSVLVILGVAILFAAAVPLVVRQRRAAFALIAALLSFELLAAPRTLYPADMPAVMRTIANDSRPVKVLHIPFGIRDGLATHGNFNPAALYYQTAHHKPLVGGYLSRLSEARQTLFLTHPVTGPLIRLSEGRTISAEDRESARAAAPTFMRDLQIGWVVIDEQTATPELQAFVIETLGVSLQERSDVWALYAPTTGLVR